MNAFVECSLYACFHAKYNLHLTEVPVVILFYKSFITIFDIKSYEIEDESKVDNTEEDNISS